MPRQLTMHFSRDRYEGPACLEYSWMPEGRRLTIQLGPNQASGFQTHIIDDTLHPLCVQVYTLNNNGRVGLTAWQFPAAPGPDIMDASVAVLQDKLFAIGEAHYTDDGTLSPPSAETLNEALVNCPEIL